VYEHLLWHWRGAPGLPLGAQFLGHEGAVECINGPRMRIESLTLTTAQTATVASPTTSISGTVEGIYVATVGSAPMQGLPSVQAVAGCGLEGDRYYDGSGTYSQLPGGGREVTLIDAAALEALEREHGIRLEPGASRRNLITRGMRLLDLVGKRFWVGQVLMEGIRDCPPCDHLAKLTGQKGVIRALANAGGLRAEIRKSGTIRVGDHIRLAE
jgi:MOSC domain-containing protein YiiM